MVTCSQQGYLQHWLCYGLGAAWGALYRAKGLHFRRIHRDRPEDFPNTVHKENKQLFPLNKRGPPFTSAQALVQEGMERHGGISFWKELPSTGSNADASGLCTCIGSVWVKTTTLTCLVWKPRTILPLLAHSLRLTTSWLLLWLPFTPRFWPGGNVFLSLLNLQGIWCTICYWIHAMWSA